MDFHVAPFSSAAFHVQIYWPAKPSQSLDWSTEAHVPFHGAQPVVGHPSLLLGPTARLRKLVEGLSVPEGLQEPGSRDSSK